MTFIGHAHGMSNRQMKGMDESFDMSLGHGLGHDNNNVLRTWVRL
jgi:hypothetical protein